MRGELTEEYDIGMCCSIHGIDLSLATYKSHPPAKSKGQISERFYQLWSIFPGEAEILSTWRCDAQTSRALPHFRISQFHHLQPSPNPLPSSKVTESPKAPIMKTRPTNATRSFQKVKRTGRPVSLFPCIDLDPSGESGSGNHSQGYIEPRPAVFDPTGHSQGLSPRVGPLP